MPYVSCIIYDLDGTLADTAPDITAAINRLRSSFGLSALEEDHVRRFIGDGPEGLLLRAIHGRVDDPIWKPEDILPRSAIDMDELMAQFRGIYNEDPVVSTKLKKGVAPMLKHWQALGTAQILLTNKPHDITEKVLQALYLDRIFDIVIGRGATSHDGQVLPHKPDGAIIDWILEEMGSEREETYMIGDGVADIEVAINGKIPCIAVLDGYTDAETLLAKLPNLELAATSIEHAHQLLLERHDD
ncbi:MAG: HAD hydrolase-like protein [Planctomycetota bacterium]